MTIESEPGVGTTAVLHLPVVERRAREAQA
jgi:hypothetical protein